jgi:trk system potassium uptake protein TrkH
MTDTAAQARPSPTMRLWRAPLLCLGVSLVSLAVLMALTGLYDVRDAENPGGHFAASVITLFVGGGLLITFQPGERRMERISLRSAFLVTAVGWLVIPVFAAMPFMMTAEPLSFTDAVFEATSGLTTTGSTVIVGLDDYPRGLLLWRSLLQWLGGVGIVLIAVVLLPFLRVGGMQLFQLESTDRSGERIIPQAGALIVWLVAVNIALNAACAIAYAASGMTAFDAINHALTTIATGGYSTHDASLGHYDSAGVRWTATVFMLAGALPFFAYIKAVRGRISGLVADRQIRFFLGAVGVIILLAELGRWAALGDDAAGTLSHTAVNIVSIVTTTGYASEDYQLWGQGYVTLFLLLTFLGGCAGSTAGGIKMYRFQLLFFIARDYMRGLFDPNVVRPHRFQGRSVDEEVTHAVLAFVAIYVAGVSLGALALAITGLDLVTAFSGASQAIANVGPGLGPVIGPAGNFASLPDAAKWVLCALMLLGRLELFALLVLLDPRFWRG